MDKPTPQGFVHDAEEALGRARAMREQARADAKEWARRVVDAERYLDRVYQWVDAGGTGPRPKKPEEY